MPEYRVPGVFQEATPPATPPIPAVGTTTAAFVGTTERGPIVPRTVTSWAEYTRWFGGFLDRTPGGTAFKYLPYAVKGFFENGGAAVAIARVYPSGATPASASLCDGSLAVTAIGPGSWGRNILLRIGPASLAQPGTPTAGWFQLALQYFADGIPDRFADAPGDPHGTPDVSETFDNLSASPADRNYAPTLMNGTSCLVTLRLTGVPVAFDSAAIPLQDGGDSGVGEPGLPEYTGDASGPTGVATGLLALASMPGIALIAIPDEVVLPEIRAHLLEQCETLQDRFAILGATQSEQMTGLATLRTPRDSSYGAFYLPWISVPAPHTAQGYVRVPPTGHIAGIYARVDLQRGVYKAPSNEVVSGLATIDAGGVAVQPLLTAINDAVSDALNTHGINTVRDFRNTARGVRVWGALTMSSDPQWKYINVRRLLIFLQQSLQNGTRWVQHQPNNEVLWNRLQLAVSAFLLLQWRGGALMGATPQQAFFTRCDRSTMTPQDLQDGRLVCVLGVAPLKPSEFLIVKLSLMLH